MAHAGRYRGRYSRASRRRRGRIPRDDAACGNYPHIVAVAYLPIGALRSQLGDPRVLVLETAGMLVFGALALGALLAEGRTAQYLLAAAWLGHGMWDVAHHLADRVVPRWYAEICAVLDVFVAVGIILTVPHM